MNIQAADYLVHFSSTPPCTSARTGRGSRLPRRATRVGEMRRGFNSRPRFHLGARLRLIATLHAPVAIRKLLAHLGMARSGPSPGPPAPGAVL
jgi:hypothetical protein